ncbi:MAG TPA: hypothetical protein VGE97_03220 [Nitrososphaera sp.]
MTKSFKKSGGEVPNTQKTMCIDDVGIGVPANEDSDSYRRVHVGTPAAQTKGHERLCLGLYHRQT